MTISDWIMIGAVFSGPIVAVQLTRYLDNKASTRQRKQDIFKTLMSTRQYATNWNHVMTLNLIDLEFNSKKSKEKEVVEAWKAYLDLLNTKIKDLEQWDNKRVELLVDLLHKMSIVLGYDFDKTHIKNSSYSPVAHGDFENEHALIRKGLIEIIKGDKNLKMEIMNLPTQEKIKE